MPFVAPLIAALTGGIGSIYEKIALSRSHITWHNFLVVIFFLLFIFTVILYPLLGWISIDAIQPKYIILFIAEVGVAVIYNYYYYRSFEHESLHEIEVSVMTAPIARILLAAIVLPAERNIHVFLAALVAAGALIFANIERRHLKFDKYSIGMLIYVFFVAVEALLAKELLDVYSPVAFYALRTFVIFLIFSAMFRPNLKNLSNQDWKKIVPVAIFAVPMMVLSFYGFSQFGIVYTTLILLIAPLIVFWASYYIFKERIKKRMIIAAVIIVAAIIYVNVMRYI